MARRYAPLWQGVNTVDCTPSADVLGERAAVNTPVNKKEAIRITPGFVTQLRNYVELMRLNKPIGIWLLLWPTLWALWLAGEGHPDPGVFTVFVVGVVVMRSAGCVLNDFADRNIDPYVERTRARLEEEGASLYRGPLLRDDRKRMAQFLDPFGNVVGIVGPSVRP